MVFWPWPWDLCTQDCEFFVQLQNILYVFCTHLTIICCVLSWLYSQLDVLFGMWLLPIPHNKRTHLHMLKGHWGLSFKKREKKGLWVTRLTAGGSYLKAVLSWPISVRLEPVASLWYKEWSWQMEKKVTKVSYWSGIVERALDAQLNHILGQLLCTECLLGARLRVNHIITIV